MRLPVSHFLLRVSARLIKPAWIALLAWAVTASSVARAADDDDDDAVVAPQPAGQQVFILTPENFDQWVFNGVGNSAQAMKQLESQIDLQMEAIDRVCKLTDSQKLKLQLAGSGDIKKFRDQYEQLRLKFQNTKQNPNNLNNVFQAIAPLQQQWQAGILGDTSLFRKVLKNTLTAEQWTAYEEEESQRYKFQYKSKIKLAIAALQGSVALNDDQRQKFETLLLDETKPPKKFSQAQYDFYVVMIQASKLPEQKLTAIFDASQMRAMQRVFQQTKGMEQMLRQEGVLPN
jgi:hypothetical protein